MSANADNALPKSDATAVSASAQGVRAASLGGAFLGWLGMKIAKERYQISFTENDVYMLGIGATIVAGFVHELVGVLLSKIRRS